MAQELASRGSGASFRFVLECQQVLKKKKKNGTDDDDDDVLFGILQQAVDMDGSWEVKLQGLEKQVL